MKILMLVPFVGNGSNLSGTPSHVLKCTRGLRNRGCEVRVFETRGAGDKHSEIDYSSSTFFTLFKLPFVLFSYKPDVVHSHTHLAGLVALPFCKLFGIKHFYECHGVPRTSENKPYISEIFNNFENLVVSFSDGVITQAKAMQNRLLVHKSSSKKSIVNYPGLVTKEFSEYSGEAVYYSESLRNKMNVIYIGTSLPYQGLDILAKAQKYITDKDIHFVLYLSDKSSKKVIDEYDFNQEVTSIVDLEDSSGLPGLLKAANILVHARPDIVDNINVQSKLGLYLASGKPIVATGVGDYVDLLGDSEFAFLTDASGEAFAKGILSALRDTEANLVARSEGPILAKKYFEVEHNVDRLLQFYRGEYVS